MLQHRDEILTKHQYNYTQAVKETFSEEFSKLLQSCLFIPFLHEKTPQPTNLRATPPKYLKAKSFLPKVEIVTQFMLKRRKAIEQLE